VAHDPAGDERDGSARSALWRARWLMLGATLAAGVGGYGVSQLQPATYTAETRMVLTSAEDEAGLDVADHDVILTAPSVLESARAALADGTNFGEPAGSVEAWVPPESAVIAVMTTAPTAQQAVERAKAVTGAYAERTAAEGAQAVAVVQEAALPSSPTSPHPLGIGLFLAALGGLLASAVVLRRAKLR
jgi:uncharacterized protein involved in exopolysaccharide biosynthesis